MPLYLYCARLRTACQPSSSRMCSSSLRYCELFIVVNKMCVCVCTCWFSSICSIGLRCISISNPPPTVSPTLPSGCQAIGIATHLKILLIFLIGIFLSFSLKKKNLYKPGDILRNLRPEAIPARERGQRPQDGALGHCPEGDEVGHTAEKVRCILQTYCIT